MSEVAKSNRPAIMERTRTPVLPYNILTPMPQTWTKIVLGLLMGCFGTSAAQYYVDPNGDDSNPGTQDKPWRTIQKAANAAFAGDTVIVRSGEYQERVTLPYGRSGSLQAPIVFRAEPPRTVRMRGFRGDRNDHIRIEGFVITYDGPRWLGGGIWLDGSNWEIVNNQFVEVHGAAIQPTWQSGKVCSNIVVAGNHMLRCNKGIIASGYGWLVESNEVERLIYYSQDADYARFFGAGHVFRKNKFHGTLAQEIGNSHVDGFQTFDNNGNIAQNILIEGNLIQGFYHQGMMLANSTAGAMSNIVVRNNIFVNSASWGICAYGIEGLKVYNNVFAFIANSAIGFRAYDKGPPTTGEVMNNIFYEFGAAYWAEAGCTLVARGNLLYRPGRISDPERYPGDLCNIDPLFVDAKSGDFRLRQGSPAIDAGVTLTSFAWDINGTVRPQGAAWDIGPYEFPISDVRLAPPERLRVLAR